MKGIRRILHHIPKPLRFLFDLLLAAVLFFAWFVARGGPRYGEEERFRRAEKANLVGPSVLLDKMYVQGDWIPTHYNRLLIGDSGDEILFYTLVNGRRNTEMDGALIRRDKSDGILLTPLPDGFTTPLEDTGKDFSIPLFLFVDDPAAVRAEVELQLTEDWEVSLNQYRGADAPPEQQGWAVRERYFLLLLPVPSKTWGFPEKGEALRRLLWINDPSTVRGGEFPAVIRLYDAEDRLLETRDYVIRSRAADARET